GGPGWPRRPRRRRPGRPRPGLPRCAWPCAGRPFETVRACWFLPAGRCGSARAALGGREGGRLLGPDQPDADQVEGADELRRQPEPARPRDRVPQRDGPAVLQQDQQAGAVGRDLLEHVPGRLLAEDPPALGDSLGAALGPDLEPCLAGRAQADQPAHQGAEGGLLGAAQLALVQDLDPAPSASLRTPSASTTRTRSLSRSRSSSSRISPWKSGCLNPRTSSWTGPMAIVLAPCGRG